MKKAARWLLVGLIVSLTVGFTNSSNGGCFGTYSTPVTYPGPCTLQVTLNKADAGYTSDLYLDGPSPDLLIANTKYNVGHIARRYIDPAANPRFFINVNPKTSFWGTYYSYQVFSDSSWALTQAGETDNVKIIAFEDIPTSSSDRDYNDVVIAVEKVNCGPGSEVVVGDPGETPPPSDPNPPPPVVEEPTGPPAGAIVIPAGGIAKVHANFLEATWDAGDLYLDGNPPELLIAKGSNKKAASARNFFPAGEYLVFLLIVDTHDYYSTDTSVARLDPISTNNYRIYYDLDDDGDFNDAIVHIVLSPPE